MQIDSWDKTFFRDSFSNLFSINFVQQCKVFHKKQIIVTESNSNL